MKTSPKRSYSVIENERFGLVFAKTVSIISGTGLTANAPVATVLGSIPASIVTVESEGRQIKQCWIYSTKNKIKNRKLFLNANKKCFLAKKERAAFLQNSSKKPISLSHQKNVPEFNLKIIKIWIYVHIFRIIFLSARIPFQSAFRSEKFTQQKFFHYKILK